DPRAIQARPVRRDREGVAGPLHGRIVRRVGERRVQIRTMVERSMATRVQSCARRPRQFFSVIVLTAAACRNSNTVSGPSPTPTPAPLPLTGTWVGDWGSNEIVLCHQEETGASSASLTEEGTVVRGSVQATGGCGFSGSFQATRSGNVL